MGIGIDRRKLGKRQFCFKIGFALCLGVRLHASTGGEVEEDQGDWWWQSGPAERAKPLDLFPRAELKPMLAAFILEPSASSGEFINFDPLGHQIHLGGLNVV